MVAVLAEESDEHRLIRGSSVAPPVNTPYYRPPSHGDYTRDPIGVPSDDTKIAPYLHSSPHETG